MSHSTHSVGFLSKASHFAGILVIPTTATLGFLAKHYFQYRDMAPPIHYSPWFNHSFFVDTSLWAHAFCFGILLFGLGSAILTLQTILRLEGWNASCNTHVCKEEMNHADSKPRRANI